MPVSSLALGAEYDARGISLSITTSMFFDRPAIERLMDMQTSKALGTAGAVIRTFARRSMRYVTAPREVYRQIVTGKRQRWKEPDLAPSAPGTPPHAIRPHPWLRGGSGSFLGIFYGFDAGRRTVVIGPNRAPGASGNVPALHEFGGVGRIRNKRRRTRKVGGAGEIDVRGGEVVYAPLTSPRQAARANRLNEELYGPLWRIANYPARPYMRPALMAVQDKLPRLWAQSVGGEAPGIADVA
jgi:hypothetical protein